MNSSEVTNSAKLWKNCLDYMSLRIKSSSFNTWFRQTRASVKDERELVITVPNQFVADWINDRYADLIVEAVQEISGRKLDYSFAVDPDKDEKQTEITFFQPAPSASRNNFPLNERFSFETFVVGTFNQFAHAASFAVAEAPGKTNYNPLLVYGSTGLGKTHLAQAVGQYVHKHYPSKKIIYATSEKFTSDFINAVSNGTIGAFTSRYRSADVLLIDDIQFFSGKESTQEQFFHTFNDLFHSGKQIVLTSDRHPRDIKGLEERLLSRFSSGLVADLQPPDLETRSAILRNKVDREQIAITEEVLFFIASHITSNIRELEGSLTRLIAYASLEKKDITLEFASRVLGKDFNRSKKILTIPQIQKKAADFFHIDVAMMTAKKKTSQIAIARQVAMYLARNHTEFSLKSIGEAFGGRDHTTVIHACDLVEKKLTHDPEFRDKIENLLASIQN